MSEAAPPLSEKQISALLNSGDSASPVQLDEALAVAQIELKEALETRPVVKKLDLSDSDMLRRFLIARKLNVESTAAMLEAHVAWRERTLPIQLSEVRDEVRKGKAYVCRSEARALEQ